MCADVAALSQTGYGTGVLCLEVGCFQQIQGGQQILLRYLRLSAGIPESVGDFFAINRTSSRNSLMRIELQDDVPAKPARLTLRARRGSRAIIFSPLTQTPATAKPENGIFHAERITSVAQ